MRETIYQVQAVDHNTGIIKKDFVVRGAESAMEAIEMIEKLNKNELLDGDAPIYGYLTQKLVAFPIFEESNIEII